MSIKHIDAHVRSNPLGLETRMVFSLPCNLNQQLQIDPITKLLLFGFLNRKNCTIYKLRGISGGPSSRQLYYEKSD
jgi:hypothetical protein